jgi:citrate lyase beta subunit
MCIQATAQGQGACLLDGKLIETLHAENAQRIIQLHENIQAFEEAAGIALG